MKKILITGGAGFIGSNLALALLAQQHDIVVLDNLSEQIHGKNPATTPPLYNNIKDKVSFFKGDVAVRADGKKILFRVDVAIHFTAEMGT